MANSERQHALLTLGGYGRTDQDTIHAYTSVARANAAGHDVAMKKILLRIQRPGTAHLQGHPDVPAEPLSRDACREAAGLAIARIDAGIELSSEEIEWQSRFAARAAQGAGKETIQQSYGDILNHLGGVAIIEGTPLGLNIAAGFYQDLRQHGNPS